MDASRPLHTSPLAGPRAADRAWRRRTIIGRGIRAVLAAGGLLAAGLTLWGMGYRYTAVPTATGAAPADRIGREAGVIRGAAAPRGVYIVIDRGNNRLFLRRGDTVLLEAVVSTGSGAVLRETTGQQRTWRFETPTGRFRILDERTDPVWTRPDWSFLEEGLPIPEQLEDRVERGALGEYALGIGDGYLIHGTLYERLLGYSVTHGCIRVGREDLRTIVARVRPGTPVYIF